MSDKSMTFLGLALKTIVVHTVTYFAVGLLASILLDYGTRFSDPSLSLLMRPIESAWVVAGPLFQPIRGIVFAIIFWLLREALFGKRYGWLIMWAMLVLIGIISTFGPSPGSIEGAVYTTLPWWTHVFGLPEVLLQSFLLSFLLYHWVNHPDRKWLTRVLIIAFIVCLALPILGLLAGQLA
jgi:hypothetical protein